MAREPVVVAAGGIVVKRGGSSLIAVVQMRKRADWVLPKGKLDPGEAPRDAAEREVLEETGHAVSHVGDLCRGDTVAQVAPQAIAPGAAAQPLPRPPLAPAPRGALQKFWHWLAG